MKRNIHYRFVFAVLLGQIVIACQNGNTVDQDDTRAVYYHDWGPAISITAREFHFFIPDLEYKITNPKWTAVSLPHKDILNNDLSE
jgi:hypothetical protein